MSLEGMIFIDWDIASASVHFAGRGTENAFGSEPSRGFQNIQRSIGVGLHVRVRSEVGVGYANESGQVEGHFYSLKGVVYAPRVAHITGDDFHIGLEGRVIQPAARAVGVVTNQDTSTGSERYQTLRQVASDKTARSRY